MALEKVRIMVEHTGEQINVMFNPEKYTINKDNNFASQGIPGRRGPLLQFVQGNMRTLEMELFFDTYERRRDVRDETQRIVKLLDIDANLHAPPVLLISWASLQFRCVLARVNQEFNMFLDDGRPVRARLTVTFNEFINLDREGKEIKRQTATFTKVHVVTQGEILSGIASKHYENPQMWRPIAIASGLDDPRALFAGQTLQIPALPFVDPETGEVMQ
jgi:Contractile injection system tube protein/LysM domain